MQLVIKLIVFIAIMLINEIAFCVPTINSITGTATDGLSLVIAGGGYGIKSTAKPILWANFNSNINPTAYGVITSWSANQYLLHSAACGPDSSGCARDDTVNRSSPDKAWTLQIDPSGASWDVAAYSGYLYLFRKQKADLDTLDVNHKAFRAWYAASSAYYIGMDGDPCWSRPTTCGGNPVWGTCGGLDDNRDNWKTLELLLKSNSDNATTDGISRFYVDNSLVNDSSGERAIKMREDAGTCSETWKEVYPVHLVIANEGVPIETDHVYFDDVYLDNTWQRVMIGNANTYAASTHLEIQIPTVWADGLVTVVLNRGTFGTSDAAYLYVFDTTGTPNSTGYPITFGGSYGNPSAQGCTMSGTTFR